MLEVNKINVFYGDAQALWDVTFKVDKGEIVTIVGANGAGKSTTLKTIGGVLRPRPGEITFLGKRIDALPAHKTVEEGIAHIMEGRRLFPYMTVQENLELGAYNPKAWMKRKETLEWVYELFPILKERKDQLAGTLSGGEQQMLAIGRGLMSMPKLLMLDEPSLGLAPKLVMQVFDIIKKINEQGITILLVEQNVQHALTLADRGYVLENGRIAMEGTGEELLKNPHVKKVYLGI
jgi:branched-chain amino acid transport system ATP-binding protein